MKPLRSLSCFLFLAMLLATGGGAVPTAKAAGAALSESLAAGFASPPAAARPWVYWFWLDGNITSNGITADLEAMRRTGIGGVLIMEVDQGAPKGPAAFGGPLWRELFKHVCAEAHRLGLEVNMNNDAGWCGSGGPWITPDLAMQKVVWSETEVSGPRHFEGALPQPATVAGFYRDIAVFAFPTPAAYRIAHLSGKSALTKQEFPPTATFPALPAEKTIPRGRLVNLTTQVGSDGRLAWDVPEGKWTLLRLGHTPTGANNAPSPMAGRGLECDKLSKEAASAQFAGLMQKLVNDSKPLVPGTLVATHIDSWEVGSQNWTPRFREEFQRVRHYDPLPYLPVLSGRVVDSLEVSERFLWDVRQTISDLLVENYAGHFRALARQQGLRLSIEAYDGVPCDEMVYAGQADEPMGEFWSYSPYSGAHWCLEMASAAHIYGKLILGAEAFTATDAEKWLAHPGSIKAMGDWAFCEGINRFVFHRYALQPWPDRRPGMSMGPWGLHYERTQTWWEQTGAWHEYLARCQYLLQQGLFVADVCFLQPERAPQRFQSPTGALDRPEYNFDGGTAEAVLTRMKVKNGRLVLPDGMSYRLLVLPQTPTMTPPLLRQIAALVKAGATVVGAPPLKSPTLEGYPQCDEEVRRLAAELWGEPGQSASAQERAYGKGRVIWGGDYGRPQEAVTETASPLAAAKWIWRQEGNPAISAPPGTRYFRRVLALEPDSRIESAELVMTADNSFECWVNGRRAGTGEAFNRAYTMKIGPWLKPGTNLITVAAVNSTETPNPAGLIGTLRIRLRDGRSLEIPTDQRWQAATAVAANWTTDLVAGDGWASAMELGAFGMGPWGEVEQSVPGTMLYPKMSAIGDLLAKQGVPPDFISQTRPSPHSFRYIHKTIGETELYFVANKNAQAETGLCRFRVAGKRPELWWPETGRLERVAVYDEADGCTRLPLRLEPAGSVFVVFREKAGVDPERVVSVTRNGAPILEVGGAASAALPRDNNAGITNDFTLAVWVRPAADTALPAETNSGIRGMSEERNDALFPPPGHEVYGDDTHAGAGLAVGRNGICVFEHGADYFAGVLVWKAAVTDWTHLAVVYRQGVPRLYVNGQLARQGMKSAFVVHPGTLVQHGRTVTRFRGDLGDFEQMARALSDAEVAQLAQSMPRPAGLADGSSVEVARTARGGFEVLAWQAGDYTLKTAKGRQHAFTVATLPAPVAINGSWGVRFAPGWGAPERVTMDRLISWSDSSEAGVKYFSGAATYSQTLRLAPELFGANRRQFLDLGQVEVMAEVRLNGHALGTLWKTPFRMDVTSAAKPGANQLEIKVVNLWINRMIGDEQLAEDSDRNPNGTLKAWPQWVKEGKPSPSGRYTFTSWRLWKKNDALQPSGLLGPVRLEVAERVTVK